MAMGHARASIADAAECSSCRLRGRRGTIRCVAANFASYLRVYEPLTAFDRDRQVYWRRYVKDGRAITPADGPIRQRSAVLEALGAGWSRLPDLPEDAYVMETDEEMRQKSNRTYQRILASLPPEVARRYGYAEGNASQLQERLKAALAAEDWPLVDRLSSGLAMSRQSAAG